MSKKDSSKGKIIELPAEISYLRYAAARSKEIKFLKKSLASSTGTKLIFQKLPKHMRRRAMSHNVKRLPRRLRQIHLNQMEKSGGQQKEKRPSRRFRRRPNNIIQEFARRQLKRKWLNTHLWHAKRFHMIEKWGYKLPFKPCDKGFRACYRATAKHCLIQDISYCACIEIIGEYDLIVERFELITDKKSGLSIAAKAFSRGNREGCVTLFKYDASKKAIGQVNFIWKAILKPEERRHLWIWIHPAFYSEVLQTLLKLFEAQSSHMEINSGLVIPQYSSKNGDIKILELKSELNRFRLTGPLANAVIQNCFKTSAINTYSFGSSWLSEYLENDEQRQIFANQLNFWSFLKGKLLTDISPHTVVSVIVEDPRMNLPKKRTKSSLDLFGSSDLYVPTDDICYSVLWNQDVREKVSRSKVSNAKICELRSNLLIPGTDIQDNSLRVPVPLILIQRPGCKENNLGYGSGWDIILPAAWAQPIWISLVMWNARPGGLKETDLITFEAGKQLLLYPDTEAGKKEEEEICASYKEAYFRKPPNKRVNYNKLSICNPFSWNWKMLIKEWKSNDNSVDDFIVLRDKQQLRNLQEALRYGKNTIDSELLLGNYLIPVHLKCLTKGLPLKFGLICLPHESDYRTPPVEPVKPDANQRERKELRKNHKSLLKTLRHKRVKAKKMGNILPVDEETLSNYRNKMRQLWLPETENITNSCSRRIIGYIRYGDFSFSLAQGSAIGYIAVGSLPHILKLKQQRVLFRNPNSRQYRLALLDIICE